MSSSAYRTVIQRYGKQKSSNINHLASRCCPLKRRRPNICLPLHLNTRLRGGRVVTVHPQYEIIPSNPGNHIKSEFVCSARIRLSPALAICYAAHPLSVCVCLSLTRTVTVPWARVQREEGILSCGNTGGRSSGPGHVYSSNGTMTYPTVNTARTRQQDNSAAYPSPGGGWAPRHQASRGYMCPHPSLFRGCHVQRDSRGIQCLTEGT